MAPISCEKAVARLTAIGAPVLLADTCALLDMVRAPIIEAFSVDDAAAVRHAIGRLEAPTPSLSIVVNEQVVAEFGKHCSTVEAQTRDMLAATTNAVSGMLTRMGGLAGAVPLTAIDLAAQGFPQTGLNLVERLLSRAVVLADADTEKVGAMHRVSYATPPASRGKASPQDCLITETYLRLALELRAARFDRPIVFFSSNTRDYCGPGRTLLPPLQAEFDASSVSFASRWVIARYAS